MTPTETQKALCNAVIAQAEFWRDSNDIDSLTHYNENETEIYKLVYEGKISKANADLIVNSLDRLYYRIRTINEK